MAPYMPQTLIPLPFFNNKIEFLKEVAYNYENGPINPLEMPNVTGVPIYKKEAATIHSYTYMGDRQFVERSTYHKMQMLGKGSSYNIRTKLPSMRHGFESKAAVDRRSVAQNALNNGLQKKSHNSGTGRQSQDARATHTLSYSETVGVSGVNGRHTDVSNVNTVFGLTTRMNGNGDNKSDLNGMQESAKFGGACDSPGKSQISKSNNGFADEMNKSNGAKSINKSEFLEKNDLNSTFYQKAQQVPELHANWFQFYTDFVYCSATSLVMKMNKQEFKIPFGIAKLVLASKENMDGFVKATTFNPDGEFLIDSAQYEAMRGARIDSSTFIRSSSIYLNKTEINLT